MNAQRLIRGRTASGLATVAALAALSGCGLPADGTSIPVDRARVPYDLLSTAAPGLRPALALTDGPHLRLVRRVLPGRGTDPVTVALVDLAQGPTRTESALGLGTALPEGTGLRLAGRHAGVARVEVSGSGGRAPVDVVVAGQIVLTVTAQPGIASVQLLRDGRPVPALLPGGRATGRPLTAADYQALLG